MAEKSCFYCGSVRNMAVVEAYEIGKSVEQERIIKLLEGLEHHRWIGMDTEDLIALIKGEK